MSTLALLKEANEMVGENEEVLNEINWATFVETGVISNEEKNIMTQLNSAATPHTGGYKRRLEIIGAKPTEYATALSKLVTSVNSGADTKFVYVVTLEAMRNIPDFATVYHNKHNEAEAYNPFLRALYKDDVFTKACAVEIIACMWERFRDLNEKELERAVEAGITLIKAKAPTAIRIMMKLLRGEPARVLFEKGGGLPLLSEALRTSRTNVQVVYESVFCLWLVSYSVNLRAIDAALKDIRIVPIVHDVLRHAVKEKVIRICLLTLTNLIKDMDGFASDYVADMVSLSVPKTLKNLNRRKFEDEDVPDLLTNLDETLEKNIDKLSSFDEYRQELYSRNLEWTPAHKSDKFWRENMGHFEADDFKAVRELVAIIQSDASEPTCLAVALHDLGQFVRFHPLGKRILSDRLEAKGMIMKLIDNGNEEIRKNALLCLQKLMIRNWEFLQK